MSDGESLLSPRGSLRFEIAALGMLVLLMRLAVLFVLPPLVVDRLARARHREPRDEVRTRERRLTDSLLGIGGTSS